MHISFRIALSVYELFERPLFFQTRSLLHAKLIDASTFVPQFNAQVVQI